MLKKLYFKPLLKSFIISQEKNCYEVGTTASLRHKILYIYRQHQSLMWFLFVFILDYFTIIKLHHTLKCISDLSICLFSQVSPGSCLLFYWYMNLHAISLYFYIQNISISLSYVFIYYIIDLKKDQNKLNQFLIIPCSKVCRYSS